MKTMQDIYGVLSGDVNVDVSKTERGAKQYATKNGFDVVTIRYNCGCHARQIAKKVGKKWVKLGR